MVVSPLPRAQRTAAAIAQAIGVQPQIDAGLREFAIGDWEGRTFRDLAETEDLWGRWAADPAFTPPNGESPRSFGERVLHDVPALVERYPGETIVAVTHGGVIGCLLDAWLGKSNGDWTRWEPHNCGISLLEWDGVSWHGLLVDDFSHLTEMGD